MSIKLTMNANIKRNHNNFSNHINFQTSKIVLYAKWKEEIEPINNPMFKRW